jgi:peptide/nickel transport system substrate-binding protein
VPADLLPVLRAAPGVKVGNFNPLGNLGMARFNHTQAPSSNAAVRRAIAKALNQEEALRAAVGNPDFFRVCHSVFPCGTTFASDAGKEWISRHSLDEARQILREGGYNGEKFVILATTDITIQTAYAAVIADTCRRIGINVESQAMDWATVLQRRANRNPIDQGGWNMFVTWWEGADLLDPVVQFALAGNGDRAWVGWANDPVTEDLRKAFAEAPDVEAKKAIAAQVQLRQHQQFFQVYLGQFFVATGFRDNISGILNAPPFFWNIRKT